MKDIIIIGRKRRYSSVSLNDNNNIENNNNNNVNNNNINASAINDNNGFTLLDSLFHQRKYGERARWPKCAFILMAIGLCSIGTGLLVFIYNPYDLIFKWKLLLSEGGEIYTLWQSPPVDLFIKIYLFNITNSKEFLSGREKLKVQQVGPYVYKEILTHDHVVFNDNGTVSTVPNHPLIWQEDMSEGNKEDDLLMLPNIALLSIAEMVASKSYFFRLPINVLIRQTKSQPIVTTTAKEFMFSYDSPLTSLGHKILPNWISFEKVGIIDRMYDFGGDFETFYTGDTDPNVGGLYESFRGSPNLPQWDDPHCNNIQNASDGTKFKSFADPNEKLMFFRKSMCRASYIVRVENETTVRGLSANKYMFEENAMDNGYFDERNKCFCRDGQCLPRGLLDVSECYYGFPIALSYPHFYDSDPKLLEGVDGLSPNKSLHESYFYINSHSGLPLKISVKFQINMAMSNMNNMAHVEMFSDVVLPVVWFEIMMPKLPPALENRFSFYLNVMPLVQSFCIYSSLMVGALLLILGVSKTTWRLSSLLKPDISKNAKHMYRSSSYLPCEEQLIESSNHKNNQFITVDDNMFVDEMNDTNYILLSETDAINAAAATDNNNDGVDDAEEDDENDDGGTSYDISDYGSCDRNSCELKGIDTDKIRENPSYSSTSSNHSSGSSSSGVVSEDNSNTSTVDITETTVDAQWAGSDQTLLYSATRDELDDMLTIPLCIIEENDIISSKNNLNLINCNAGTHKSLPIESTTVQLH